MQSTLTINDDPASCEQAIQLFDQHGALWIKNLLSPDFVRELHEAFTSRYASKPEDKLARKFAKVGDRRYMITTKIRPPFDSVALSANPRLMPLLKHFLGSHLVISSFGTVVAFPGAAAQPVHFDHPPLFESERTCSTLPPHAITLVVPLIELTEATGSTAIWEGSHRAEGSRQQLEQLRKSDSFDGSVTPHTQLGDAYLMDFRVIHAGTANTSSIARPILYVVYTRPWFQEEANFAEQPPLRISDKRFKKLTKEQRTLFARAEA